MAGREPKSKPAIDIMSGLTEGLPEEFVDSETAADLEHSEGLDSNVPKERVRLVESL